MRGVVFDQIVRTVVELAREAEVEQAGGVDGKDFEAEGVPFDGLKAELVGGRDLVILVEGLGPDAEDADVFLGDQQLEDVFLADLFLDDLHGLLQFLDLGDVDLLEPLVLGGEGERGQQLLLLRAGDQLAVHQPIEGLYVGGVLLDALLVGLDGHELVVLRLVALRPDVGPAALHLLVAVGAIQLHVQRGQTLLILLVEQECAGSQQLEADIVRQQLVLEEERVDLLEVAVPEVALAQQVDCGYVVVGEGDKLVAEEDGVGVVMNVEVVDGEVVEPAEALVGEDEGGEVLELGEVVLGVAAVVGLEELRQEEDPVGLAGREDGRLLSLLAHLLNLNIGKASKKAKYQQKAKHHTQGSRRSWISSSNSLYCCFKCALLCYHSRFYDQSLSRRMRQRQSQDYRYFLRYKQSLLSQGPGVEIALQGVSNLMWEGSFPTLISC